MTPSSCYGDHADGVSGSLRRQERHAAERFRWAMFVL
jgi:hypothetical protein